MSDGVHTPLPQPVRRAAVAFVFVTVLIDILAFGIIIPVLPHLIETMTGGTLSNAAWWVGVFGTVFAAVQFFSSPIQGALSDRFGRGRSSCFPTWALAWISC